jgi:hypothetical protein
MVDPVLALAGAYIAKDGLKKILGPTADYLGQELKELTKNRIETIGKIFRNAEKKLGHKIEEEGSIPPKVLKYVLGDASFNNDSLAIDYIGGILASSRSKEGRDDRGARVANIIESLSTYQLRTHYLIYLTIKNLFSDANFSLANEDRAKMKIFIPLTSYIQAMDFSSSEKDILASLLSHTFFGLHSENLIEEAFQYGDETACKKHYPEASEAGIICQPSALGTELLLWAFGHPDKDLNYLFDKNFTPEANGICNGFFNAIAIKK